MLSTKSLLYRLSQSLCPTSLGTFICENIYYSLMGLSPAEMDRTVLPMFAQHTPVGASSKQLFHYAQGVNSGMKPHQSLDDRRTH